MPKQGQFAKSARRKRVNNFKVRRHQQGQTIAGDQLTDFLLVRFGLTAKKRVPRAAQETVQRFLIEVSDQLVAASGDLATLVPDLLADINHRAPWQFYMQLLPQWTLLQDFLKKELPAVPLATRCYVTTTMTTAELTQQVAKLLAEKAAAITFLKQPDIPATMRKQTSQLLVASIYAGGVIDWDKVRALLAPFPFTVDTSLDAGTQEWLQTLAKS
ncbi:MAG: hypothetical protein ACLRX6_01355 [Limosilactobacillus pontis]|uniref:Uncharacterized protein n=1 Tax=Limosilactobacillus pontis TaxID=35787 RepID=A0A2J6NNT8_9LACO|nr:hypothetical protein [Limosilactobacillus pontis]PMB82979.1 hypothetical protein CK797_03895 [Limosilactobacillus pontis]